MTERRLPKPLALVAAVTIALAWLARAEAQEGPKPPYRDRIIASDKLQELPPDDEEGELDQFGLPRSFNVALTLSRSERAEETADEQELRVGAFWESATLGNFSLDASIFQNNGDREGQPQSGGTATLWQRNLFLNGGWRVDNGLGVLSTPSPPMQRNQYRFLLPSVPFAGASTEWLQSSNGLRLQAAAGRIGYYTGVHSGGFQLGDGDVASLGAQWNVGKSWAAMASFLGSQGQLEPDPLGGATLTPGDTRAVHLATAWTGSFDTLQLNLLGSDGSDGDAKGAWLDGSSRRGRYVHHYGAFHLGTDLAWGALPINSDIEGAYYRLAYQYGRWLWNGGVDAVASVSGEGSDSLYGTGFLRYQATSTLGYGGSLSLRRSPDVVHSAQLFVDKRTRWGHTRVEFDHAGGNGDDSWQVGVDHAFVLREGSRLSASVGFGEISREGLSSSSATLALYGAQELGDKVSIDGSARWTHGDGPTAVRGVNLNLGVNWRIAPHWNLTTSIYQNQGTQRSPFILDPLTDPNEFIALPRDRSLFLTLRYDRHSGRPQPVIGGGTGGAVGAIAGSVFLDEDQDGKRSASELPAANVTVVLDGRYSLRTDNLGRFEFPRVAAGSHTLIVEADNLPLPWTFVDGRSVLKLEVGVREKVQVDMGALRQR